MHECIPLPRQICKYERLKNIASNPGKFLYEFATRLVPKRTLEVCQQLCDATAKCKNYRYCPNDGNCRLYDKEIIKPTQTTVAGDCFTAYQICPMETRPTTIPTMPTTRITIATITEDKTSIQTKRQTKKISMTTSKITMASEKLHSYSTRSSGQINTCKNFGINLLFIVIVFIVQQWN